LTGSKCGRDCGENQQSETAISNRNGRLLQVSEAARQEAKRVMQAGNAT